MTTKLLTAIRTSFLAAPVILWLFTPWPAQAVDLSETIEVCTGCHGDNGLPTQSDIPIIWGQEFYYLYVQLKDYKAGRRDSEFMTDIIGDLSKEEMQALAQHFSEKKWPPNGFRANDTDVAIAVSKFNNGDDLTDVEETFIGLLAMRLLRTWQWELGELRAGMIDESVFNAAGKKYAYQADAWGMQQTFDSNRIIFHSNFVQWMDQNVVNER